LLIAVIAAIQAFSSKSRHSSELWNHKQLLPVLLLIKMAATGTLFNAVKEAVEPLWLEACMFGLAAFMYLIIAGTITVPSLNLKPAKQKLEAASSGVKQKRSLSAEEKELDTVYHPIVLACHRTDAAEALTLLSKLNESEVASIPAKVTSKILLSAGKGFSDGELTQQLVELGNCFDAKAFELAACEAARWRSVKVCRFLFDIAKLASIQMTEKAVALIVRGHSNDSALFCSMLEEIIAENSGVQLTRTLCDALLGQCKDAGNREAAKLVLQRAKFSCPDEEVVRQAKYISSSGKAGSFKEALDAFNTVKESGGQLTPFIYNCLMDACIQCLRLETALAYFAEAKAQGLVDVVSYNTIMKGYLADGNDKAACNLLSEMKQMGIDANRVTYNGLLCAMAQRGNYPAIWRLVEEMQRAGIQSSTAFAVLLKSISCRSQAAELRRIVELMEANGKLENLEDKPLMDEVLFSSLAEACLRCGSLDLLWERTRLYSHQGGLPKIGAPICGSMIKAYGQARQVERIWLLWEMMAAREVMPTSMTLGCMVEALVMNHRVEEAWKLVNKTWQDETQRSLVNTVIYSTILKGFTMSKQHDKVCALYHEMRDRGIQCNTITYNTLLNALALCGQMKEVPQLLEDMRRADPPVLPDVVTFSTIIKGFCMSGDLDKGLELLANVKNKFNIQPDEVMFNSLLDGCAKQSRLEDALRLLDEMKACGVAPSNYTLSIVCKLLGRAKLLNKAFEMVDSVSKEYGFNPNIQVYTCLIQACIYNRQTGRAISLHDKVVREGVCSLDQKAYTSMAIGCIHVGAVDKAADVARCAYHLPGHKMEQTKGTPQGVEANCLAELIHALGYNSAAGQSLVKDLFIHRKVRVSEESCSWSSRKDAKARR